jgi:hypothetical protein
MSDALERIADRLLSVLAPRMEAKACMDYERSCGCMRNPGTMNCTTLRQSCCGAICGNCYFVNIPCDC